MKLALHMDLGTPPRTEVISEFLFDATSDKGADLWPIAAATHAQSGSLPLSMNSLGSRRLSSFTTLASGCRHQSRRSGSISHDLLQFSKRREVDAEIRP